MKLKLKIIILLLTVVFTSVLASLYTITSKYYSETLGRVYENHTYAALNTSEQIKTFITKLKISQVKQNEKILNENFPEVKHILKIKNSNIEHIHGSDKGLKPEFYSLALQNSYKPIFTTGKFLCFSLFSDDVNFVYFVEPSHIKKMGSLGQAVGIGILNTQDLTVLNIGHDEFNFVAPDSQTLSSLAKVDTVFSKVVQLKKGNILMALAPIDGDKQTFVIVEAFQTQITDLVYKNLESIFILVGVLLTIFIIVGIILANNLIAPIEYLTKATAQISQGVWQTDLKVVNNDEVGELTKAFTTMGNELAVRENKIKIINEKLIQSEKLASLGLFSAGIAHEVKNPLGAILGNAQLIQRKSDGNTDIARYSKTIVDESYRANNIVQDLLVFAKEKPLNLTNVDLEVFQEHLKNVLLPRCQESNILLNIKVNEKYFEFDKEQLLQVLENISFNAIDALEERVDIEEKKLTISFKEIDKQLEVKITDNGIGMTKEVQSKIFEPFFSTKKLKKGTGLGMAICYGIIEKHNGSIKVESTIGEGTCFYIKI